MLRGVLENMKTFGKRYTCQGDLSATMAMDNGSLKPFPGLARVERVGAALAAAQPRRHDPGGLP